MPPPCMAGSSLTKADDWPTGVFGEPIGALGWLTGVFWRLTRAVWWPTRTLWWLTRVLCRPTRAVRRPNTDVWRSQVFLLRRSARARRLKHLPNVPNNPTRTAAGIGDAPASRSPADNSTASPDLPEAAGRMGRPSASRSHTCPIPCGGTLAAGCSEPDAYNHPQGSGGSSTASDSTQLGASASKSQMAPGAILPS